MPNGSSGKGGITVTPAQYQELVRKVAEKVWRQLREDLRVENERRGRYDRRRA